MEKNSQNNLESSNNNTIEAQSLDQASRQPLKLGSHFMFCLGLIKVFS
jgi:hypothetical protein